MKAAEGRGARASLSPSGPIRWTGLAGLAGGALWLVLIALIAARPEAPVGRSDDLNVLIALSGLLILPGLVGLYLCQAGRARWLAAAGVVLGAAGAVLVGAGLVQRPGESDAARLLVGLGILALIAGFACAGVGLLQTAILPRPAGWLLIIGSLALLDFRFEDAGIWLGVPFGLAWLWLGYELWASARPGPSLSPGLGSQRPSRGP